MGQTRRAFMRNGAMALVGTSLIPAFLTRAVLGQSGINQSSNSKLRNKTLVVLFQRGAADGLNMVVPYAEQSYYEMRPSIAIPPHQVLDLDGHFGLHPSLASFKPLWDQRQLAIVHACGSPDMSRSHFDAQDYMESGTPGIKSTPDGWLNRVLQGEDLGGIPPTPFRAVALGTQVPRTLQGKVPAVAINDLRDFAVGGRSAAGQTLSNGFEAMYDDTVNAVLHGTGAETFDAIKMLKAADPAHYAPAAGVNYPSGPFANSLRQIAQLLKANLGVEAAFADIGGWDTHQNQGSVDGQLANRLREFSTAITAFWLDMGDQSEDITIVTMSEFGRTARQNGTGGTDHGHANAMFVLGGNVRGGKVYGRWPGVHPEQLNEGRDLAVTTDFRQVLGEAAYKTLHSRDLNTVFPASQVAPSHFLNLLA